MATGQMTDGVSPSLVLMDGDHLLQETKTLQAYFPTCDFEHLMAVLQEHKGDIDDAMNALMDAGESMAEDVVLPESPGQSSPLRLSPIPEGDEDDEEEEMFEYEEETETETEGVEEEEEEEGTDEDGDNSNKTEGVMGGVQESSSEENMGVNLDLEIPPPTTRGGKLQCDACTSTT